MGERIANRQSERRQTRRRGGAGERMTPAASGVKRRARRPDNAMHNTFSCRHILRQPETIGHPYQKTWRNDGQRSIIMNDLDKRITQDNTNE